MLQEGLIFATDLVATGNSDNSFFCFGMVVMQGNSGTQDGLWRNRAYINNKKNRVVNPQIYEVENLFMLNIFFLQSSKYRMR